MAWCDVLTGGGRHRAERPRRDRRHGHGQEPCDTTPPPRITIRFMYSTGCVWVRFAYFMGLSWVYMGYQNVLILGVSTLKMPLN